MKNIILILMTTLFLSGCSLIPRITMDTPNTLPQSLNKSKVKEVCKGKAEWDELGNIKSCSKGYYKYDENYDKKERKMTITERVKSFINSLVGFGFWGIVLLLILCPSLLGLIVGRLIEGVTGIAAKTLKSTVKAVQDARKNGTDLSTALAIEQDKKEKEYIAQLKEKEGIK